MKNFLIFVSGVAVGSVVTWKLLKTRYEQLAQEEIDSVKEKFSNKCRKIDDANSDDEPDSDECEDDETSDIDEYKTRLEESGYVNYSEPFERKVGDVKMDGDVADKPYVISPDDFGTDLDYDQIELTYYSDGVLVDENNEPVEDVENVVGADSLDSFGEYEDDSVYVRNDRLKSEFAILLDHRKYSEISKKGPHSVED